MEVLIVTAHESRVSTTNVTEFFQQGPGIVFPNAGKG